LGAKQSVDHIIGVQNVFAIIQTTLSLFKTLKNLTLLKFEKLAASVVPTIKSHARSIGDAHIVCGQLTKLTLKQWLFQFILYMKHGNVVMFDAFMWN
jgi:hypothetical protein